jgi:hypothetical protein
MVKTGELKHRLPEGSSRRVLVTKAMRFIVYKAWDVRYCLNQMRNYTQMQTRQLSVKQLRKKMLFP